MICPNCGSNMPDKRKRCERCGTDLTLYKKVQRASNLYYNDGLARAKVRDLSGAVIALRKSLDLNKLNTSARNLLGLVYYEMGETVAALSEWVISKHFQPQNNDADEYINKVQSNLTRLDALNQAIKRYNTALGLAKQSSADLAMIQLKKVVTLNTNFIRAYQLLALLLMKTGDNARAKKYLQKVSKIDVTNTTTLRYLQELEAPAANAKDLDSNPEAEQSGPIGAIMPISSYKEDKPNIMAFVNLVIGVVIGLAVMAFLVIPTIKNNKSSDNSTDYQNSGYIAQLQDKDNTITTLQNEKADLQKQLTDLQTQIDNTAVPEDKTQVYVPLFDATEQYFTELSKSAGTRDFTAVADLLAGVDDTQLEIESAVTLLNRLRTEIYPDVAKAHYTKGHNLYSSAKYQEGLVELQKAMTFDPADVDAVYFAARSYQRIGDNVNAALYYNKVITDFPDSSRVLDATNFLAEVQG
ncbi:MAG TPA: tetratricopeptide repeat protein [Mobilitalea sp.]|nr:tetratricopeptide repeat protein [Mobilitalea sp.]